MNSAEQQEADTTRQQGLDANGGGDDQQQEGGAKRPVSTFRTYEDYLDSQVTDLDLYYLGDEDLARHLVELGLRGDGDALKREEFEQRKQAEKDKHVHREHVPKPLASFGKGAFTNYPLLQALANREELVRNGKLACIIFLRDYNSKNQEVSGYIDFAYRIKTENFEPYFEGKAKLMPKASDLSYYNWETQTSTSNSSPNFQVIADNESGLLFKNKRDRKVINVDPKVSFLTIFVWNNQRVTDGSKLNLQASPGDNSTRTEIETDEYIQVVIYDHMTRRKG